MERQPFSVSQLRRTEVGYLENPMKHAISMHWRHFCCVPFGSTCRNDGQHGTGKIEGEISKKSSYSFKKGSYFNLKFKINLITKNLISL